MDDPSRPDDTGFKARVRDLYPVQELVSQMNRERENL